ncbi:MAG: hypothetical protein Pars2KO_27900 [Parasphingorhabdus sp.]
MRSSQAIISDDDLDIKVDYAQQKLEELLELLDATEGCEIVALHVDQAINALKDFIRQKK